MPGLVYHNHHDGRRLNQMVWATLQRGGPKDESGGKTENLTDDVILLGRGEKCQVRFNDSAVSSQHCRLLCPAGDGDACILEDLSVNGSFVNGAKVGKGNRASLRHGDEISLLRPTGEGACISLPPCPRPHLRIESSVRTCMSTSLLGVSCVPPYNPSQAGSRIRACREQGGAPPADVPIHG